MHELTSARQETFGGLHPGLIQSVTSRRKGMPTTRDEGSSASPVKTASPPDQQQLLYVHETILYATIKDHRSIDRSEEKGATTSVFEHEHSISFGNQIGLRIPSRTFYPSLRRIRTTETIQKDGNKVVSKVGHHPRHKEAKDKLEDLEGSANVMRTWTLNWMKRVWTKALDEDDRGRSLPVQSGSCFEW
ncbi:MAG: hypothetical protein J3Q66DRAFT_419113 [Benniella sp.]|nr:MAG: hypothetical protein J3Q66DRAFT_419113 [Benniella sp.]